MNIELLYYDGCSHWETTLEELRDLLAGMSVDDEVSLIEITSREEAEEMWFPGSPTIRINDEDIDPETPDSGFSLECRIYDVEGEPSETPPREWIAAAIEAAAG